MSGLVTSEGDNQGDAPGHITPCLQETCDDVHDPQTLLPSVSFPVRRPLGPSSGNQTASRSPCPLPGPPTITSSPQSPVTHHARSPNYRLPKPPSFLPEFPIVNHVVRVTFHVPFLSLLVTLRECLRLGVTTVCFYYLSFVSSNILRLSSETDSSIQARRSYCLGSCNLCTWSVSILRCFAHPLPITVVQLGGIPLPADLGAILFLLLPGMVYLRRHWNGCRCHGGIEHPRVVECK